MAINVLVVDDSAVIRKLLTTALQKNPDICVIATAIDGKEAITITQRTQPDIIILDIEMPTMDGLTALPFLLEAAPKARIIMASRLTHKNAKASIEALERGASDYIPKPEIDNLEEFYRELISKVLALAPVPSPKHSSNLSTLSTSSTTRAIPSIKVATKQQINAIAIASSTGGPQALMKLFADLGGKLSHLPIFITQHMPAAFTPIFAEHLTEASKLICMEGKEGEIVHPGRIYVAPGDYHMLVGRTGSKVVIHTNQDAPINYCRPAADPMFQSLSTAYGANLLGLVLTGMGQDGANGAEAIVKNGGSIIAQDAASSVVYGMPRAVADRGLCQEIMPLDKIAAYLLKRCDR